MAKTQNAKVSDLIEDNLNANKGTDFGNELMEKSFSKFGAGRSVLIDKNNKLIAGNKSKAKFEEIGGENVLIIDADRDTLIAVRRNDIDLETPEGREFALADNATNKANLVWDADVVEVLAEDIEVEEWGVELPGQMNISSKNKELNIDEFEDELVLYHNLTNKESLYIESVLINQKFDELTNIVNPINHKRIQYHFQTDKEFENYLKSIGSNVIDENYECEETNLKVEDITMEELRKIHLDCKKGLEIWKGFYITDNGTYSIHSTMHLFPDIWN